LMMNISKTAPFRPENEQYPAKLWYYKSAKPWVK
jgi:hypothetical protein